MATPTEERVTYGFADEMECMIAAACSGIYPKFWAAVGHEIEPEGLRDATCQLIMRACRTIGKESGRAPAAPSIVMQRVTTWKNAGKLTDAQCSEVREFLDAMLTWELPDADAMIAEVSPIIRHTIEKAALKVGIDAHRKHGDLNTAVTKLLARAARVGKTNVRTNTRLGRAVFGQIVHLSDTQRLPTGIPELDCELEDGIIRGTYTVFLGATNAGKSMMLGHIAAEAVSMGMPVAYATLEMSAAHIYARMIANLVELPTTDIMRYQEVLDEAHRRIGILEDQGLLGYACVEYFTPAVATLDEILDWHAGQEAEAGHDIPILLIDSANDVTLNEKIPENKIQEKISGRLRDHAQMRKLWIASSAQADAAGMDSKKTQIVDLHNAAFSKGIPRAADLVVTLNPREEGIVYYGGKNRLGRKGWQVGPLPTEHEMGRMIGTVRPGFPQAW